MVVSACTGRPSRLSGLYLHLRAASSVAASKRKFSLQGTCTIDGADIIHLNSGWRAIKIFERIEKA